MATLENVTMACGANMHRTAWTRSLDWEQSHQQVQSEARSQVLTKRKRSELRTSTSIEARPRVLTDVQLERGQVTSADQAQALRTSMSIEARPCMLKNVRLRQLFCLLADEATKFKNESDLDT